MCSTFKWLLAAQVLSLVDADTEQLSRLIPYSGSDVLDYAPVTRAHVSDGGMSVAALSAAAIQYSDNTAANLLLRVVGGRRRSPPICADSATVRLVWIVPSPT